MLFPNTLDWIHISIWNPSGASTLWFTSLQRPIFVITTRWPQLPSLSPQRTPCGILWLKTIQMGMFYGGSARIRIWNLTIRLLSQSKRVQMLVIKQRQTNYQRYGEVKSTHTHTQTDAPARSNSHMQSTLSFGSLSKRVDFNLSGVDFQKQIIEPLNLVCCLWGPHRTEITWWFSLEQLLQIEATQPPAWSEHRSAIHLQNSVVWVSFHMYVCLWTEGKTMIFF